MTKMKKETFVLHNAVSLTVDDTDYISNGINCQTRKRFLLEYVITETGVLVNGDRVILKIEYSDDDVTYYLLQNGPFGYLAEEESTTPCNKCVHDVCPGEWIRLTVTTDYINADPTTNYFTITTKITLMEDIDL